MSKIKNYFFYKSPIPHLQSLAKKHDLDSIYEYFHIHKQRTVLNVKDVIFQPFYHLVNILRIPIFRSGRGPTRLISPRSTLKN